MDVFRLPRRDLITFALFGLVVITMPIWLNPLGAAYPGLLQKFAIYAIFAIGFNILFGLTGYLSFGHAAFWHRDPRGLRAPSRRSARPASRVRPHPCRRSRRWRCAVRRRRAG